MISSATEITKEWLEDVLKAQILQISTRGNTAFNSSITHLDITYSSGVNLPRKLLVKLNSEHNGRDEIQFYRFAENMDFIHDSATLWAGI